MKKFFSTVVHASNLEKVISKWIQDNPNKVIKYESITCTFLSDYMVVYSFFYN